jgi:tyrosinase
VNVGSALLNQAAAGRTGGTLVAQVTVPHPRGSSAARTFDVLVNAPPGVSSVSVDSPYYAGTIAFFGAMPGMAMNATFNVPLTKVLGALRAAKLLGANDLQVRLVPHAPVGPRLMATPLAQLRAVSVEVW